MYTSGVVPQAQGRPTPPFGQLSEPFGVHPEEFPNKAGNTLKATARSLASSPVCKPRAASSFGRAKCATVKTPVGQASATFILGFPLPHKALKPLGTQNAQSQYCPLLANWLVVEPWIPRRILVKSTLTFHREAKEADVKVHKQRQRSDSVPSNKKAVHQHESWSHFCPRPENDHLCRPALQLCEPTVYGNLAHCTSRAGVHHSNVGRARVSKRSRAKLY